MKRFVENGKKKKKTARSSLPEKPTGEASPGDLARGNPKGTRGRCRENCKCPDGRSQKEKENKGLSPLRFDSGSYNNVSTLVVDVQGTWKRAKTMASASGQGQRVRPYQAGGKNA